MSFRGMDEAGARLLAAALDVNGGALSIQGGLIRGIVAKWGGTAGGLSKTPAHATWCQEQATDVRRRLKILDADPEGVLTMAAYTGVLGTWEHAEKNKKSFVDEVREGAQEINDSQAKADALATVKALSVWKGIAAYRRLKDVWEKGKPLRATKALLEHSEVFRAIYESQLKKYGETRAATFQKPWAAASKLAGINIRGWQPLEFLDKAPGKGVFNRIFVPLAFTAGMKELLLPSHKGARGAVDRGMGLVQVVGASAAMYDVLGFAAATSSIPMVGWVTLGVAGAYFLGSWAWDKWGDDIKAGTKKAWNWTKNKSGEAWNATKKQADEAWRDTKKQANEAWQDSKKKAKETWDDTKKVAEKIVPGPIKKAKFW